MSNKRILIFSLAYHPMVGGAEIAIKEITDRIPDIEFDLVTLRFNRSHAKFERVGNVNVYRIGGGFGYLSKILFIPQVTFFALRRKYDLYWAMMTYMLFPIVLTRVFGNKTSYVLTLQDGDPWTHVFNRLRIFPFLPFLFYGFHHAVKVQAISNFLAEWAVKMGFKGRVEVIPNGVDLKKFSHTVKHRVFNKNNIVLITTSRLVEKNALGDIVDAMKFLPESVSLKILGIGMLEQVLRSRVGNLKLGNRVEFLGFVSPQEIPVYLHEADIFVRPSLSEGMGISFIEAMAVGLPVIATPVGGIPDFLKDGETGLFCEVNNPENIAEKVMEYINNPELASQIVKNARKMVEEKYNWDLITNEMKTKVFDKV